MKETILNSKCLAHEAALNPGLIGYDNGYLLATRIDTIDPMHANVPIEGTVWRYWGHPHVRLDETDAQLQPTGRRLEFHDAEDPRLFRVDGQLWVCFCRAWRQWVMPFEFNHHFERFGEALTPNFERNAYMVGPGERNWTWINDTQESLDCVYRWEPFTVLRFDVSGACLERHRNNSVILPWRYGKINGGTGGFSGTSANFTAGVLSGGSPFGFMIGRIVASGVSTDGFRTIALPAAAACRRRCIAPTIRRPWRRSSAPVPLLRSAHNSCAGQDWIPARACTVP